MSIEEATSSIPSSQPKHTACARVLPHNKECKIVVQLGRFLIKTVQ
jgi:hypothetical protein